MTQTEFDKFSGKVEPQEITGGEQNAVENKMKSLNKFQLHFARLS